MKTVCTCISRQIPSSIIQLRDFLAASLALFKVSCVAFDASAWKVLPPSSLPTIACLFVSRILPTQPPRLKGFFTCESARRELLNRLSLIASSNPWTVPKSPEDSANTNKPSVFITFFKSCNWMCFVLLLFVLFWDIR